MEKQYVLTPSPKMLDLAGKCSYAFKEDRKTNSWDNFDKFVESVAIECMDRIRITYSAKFPSLRIKRCNEQEFESLRNIYGVTGSSTRAFHIPALGLIAVNIQASMKYDTINFVTNLVLDFTEELLHAAYPSKGEIEIKKLTYDTAEEYLDIKIPEAYKKSSYERAADPSYGR